MVKTLVLFALIANALAKPGLLHGGVGPVALATHALGVAPTAVSQQSRYDLFNPGAITYSTAHAVPVLAAAPVVAGPALRVSTAATSRLDVRSPVLAAVGAPAFAIGAGHYGGGVGGGLGVGGIGGLGGYGAGGYGLGGHGYGK